MFKAVKFFGGVATLGSAVLAIATPVNASNGAIAATAGVRDLTPIRPWARDLTPIRPWARDLTPIRPWARDLTPIRPW